MNSDDVPMFETEGRESQEAWKWDHSQEGQAAGAVWFGKLLKDIEAEELF